MKFLIPRLHPVDKFLAWAAVDAGHSVDIFTSGGDKFLHEWFNPEDLVTRCYIESHQASGYDAETYIRWYGEQLDSHLRKNNIDCILPSAATDMILTEIGLLNDKHNMLGITEEQANIFTNKSEYMTMLEDAGVDVPKVYEIVRPGRSAKNYDISFPCISKPVLGTGSKGIFVSDSAEKHRWFFSESDRPQDFSEKAQKVHDRMEDGSLRNYLYHAEGGSYVVQEFFEGPCIAIGGTVQDSKLSVECIHEVDVTPLPYRSDSGFSFDLDYPDELKRKAYHVVDQLQRVLPFPDGAWRVDCIWTGDRLVVVDVSPRMCATASKALAVGSSNSKVYGEGVIDAIIGNEVQGCKPTHAVRCKVLDIPKGKVKRVVVPNWDDSDDFVEFEEPDENIYEPRNDFQSWNRGWALAAGKTLSDANDSVDRFLSELRIEME